MSGYFNACRRSEIQHPCKDCPDRKAGCSAKCEKWAAYVKKRNAAYAERLKRADKRADKRAGTDAYFRIVRKLTYLKKKDPGMH